MGDLFNQLRLARQRHVNGHLGSDKSFDDEDAVNDTLAQLLMVMEHLDEKIRPMLEQDGALFNKRCGGGGKCAGRCWCLQGTRPAGVEQMP